MNLNLSLENAYWQKIEIISTNNPFKTSSIEYYMIQFIIDMYKKLELHSNSDINEQFLIYLTKKKKITLLDSWSAFLITPHILSLASIHGIIRIINNSNYSQNSTNKFGVFILLRRKTSSFRARM
jgi:hypothetical protein